MPNSPSAVTQALVQIPSIHLPWDAGYSLLTLLVCLCCGTQSLDPFFIDMLHLQHPPIALWSQTESMIFCSSDHQSRLELCGFVFLYLDLQYKKHILYVISQFPHLDQIFWDTHHGLSQLNPKFRYLFYVSFHNWLSKTILATVWAESYITRQNVWNLVWKYSISVQGL